MLTINLDIQNFVDVYAKSKRYKLKEPYEPKDLYKIVNSGAKEKLKNILMLNNAYVHIYEIYKKEMLIKSKIYTKDDVATYSKNKDSYLDFMQNYKLLVVKERNYIEQTLKSSNLSDDEYMKHKAYLNTLNEFLNVDEYTLKSMACKEVLEYNKERYQILTNIANAFRHAKRIEEIKELISLPNYSRGLKYYKQNIFLLLDELSKKEAQDPIYGQIKQVLDIAKQNYKTLKSHKVRKRQKPSLLQYSKQLDEAYLKRLFYMENEYKQYIDNLVDESYKEVLKTIPGKHNQFMYVRNKIPSAFALFPTLIEKMNTISSELDKSFMPYKLKNGVLVPTEKEIDLYRHYMYAITCVNDLVTERDPYYKDQKKYDGNCVNLQYSDPNQYKLEDFEKDEPSIVDTYLEDKEREYNQALQKQQAEKESINNKLNNINSNKNQPYNNNPVKTEETKTNKTQDTKDKKQNQIKAVDKNLPLDKQIDEYFKGLIGLNEVKNTLLEVIAKKVLEGKNYEQGQMHMAFLGNPGTGKTTVARIVGKILFENGLINSDKVVECKFSDLYQQYVGFSAKATQDKIKEAEGGVLFIDEAHQLAVNGDGQHDYRKEIINVLVPELENNKNLLVIFAGYSKEMTEMLKHSDKGLFSRVNHRINFKDFCKEDIMALFDLEISKKKNRNDENFIVTNMAREDVSKYFDLLIKARDGEFANGREVRTTVNKILNKFGVLALKRQDIKTIDEKTMRDILTSNTFKEEILGNEENPSLINDWNNFVSHISGLNQSNVQEAEIEERTK